MDTSHKHCRPCGGNKPLPFHPVDKEVQHFLKARGKNPAGWWRCGSSGEKGRCLYVQPWANKNEGLILPDSFR